MDVDASFSGSFDRSRDVPRMGPIISPTAFGIMSGFRVFGGCNNKLKPSWSCLGAGHKAGLLLVGFGRTCRADRLSSPYSRSVGRRFDIDLILSARPTAA
jgi:hypothetical protein